MRAEINPDVNSFRVAKVRDPGHAMYEERSGAQDSCRALNLKLRAIGTLFGEPVGRALCDLIEAGGDLWAWVYPPEDERHEHDTNSGGTCRNPTCHYHSDYNEDPF